MTIQGITSHVSAAGAATILSIATANPPNAVDQSSYPDYYFRVTNSEHLPHLKTKFQRICDKSMIKKRYLFLTEETLKENPSLCTFNAPTMDLRQQIVLRDIPNLAMEAAVKAIEEWGRPRSAITHLIFCSSSTMNLPGTDYLLARRLGLRDSISRVLLSNLGCYGGGTVVRVVKDIVENNKEARALVVCAESTTIFFRGPSEVKQDDLVGSAIFGDGASAMVVGSDPLPEVENPLFQIISASQTMVQNTEEGIFGQMKEAGLVFTLSRNVPDIVSGNVEDILVKAFAKLDIGDWNSLFWAVHPGGPAILDKMETKLGLEAEKLTATRHVMQEFGNMSSASVLFVLNEIRKRSVKNGLGTTGEGKEFGVLLGFGPGITMETVVLRSVVI